MSEENMAWYHCGRCGSLFRAPANDMAERRCAKCGRNPSLGVEAAPGRAPNPTSAATPTHAKLPSQRERSEAHRQPRSNLTAKIFGVWLLATVLLVLGVRYLWPQGAGHNPAKPASVAAIKGTSGDEAAVRLNKALQPCATALGGFLDAGTPEERNQFVLNPVATAGRMARFYSLNPLTRIEPNTIKNTANTLLELPGEAAVETRWLAKDGRTFDCVFVQQNNEWRLDWEHFARYSDFPWSLFLTGAGEPELEFRLLVRERLVKERSESSRMSLVFYAPRFGYPEQTGAASPEFLVKRDSPDGLLLAAAFKQHEKGEPLFGSTLPYLEPPDMLRVRVRIRRLPADTEGTYTFELAKVVACHWLSINAPDASPAPQQNPPEPTPPAPRDS